jgi:putative ABC transport system permease protein
MRTLLQNFRIAARQLSKSPGFSLTVVVTLALGIGSTTAIFSLVEGVLLRPLPFRDPGRLVILGDHIGNGPNTPVTAREILNYAAATTAFSSMGGYTGTTYELSGGAVPQAVNGARVSAGVFTTLGVEPILGRVFSPGEENSRDPVAVIGYDLWLNRFHRDPGVLGRVIDLDRRAYTIVGVMPRSFEFPLQTGRLNQAQLWVPLSITPDELSESNAGVWVFQMVARIKDGVSLSQAAQDADRVARHFTFPANMAGIRIRGDVTPLRDSVVADATPVLRTLFFAVTIVLLIACANSAGLLLVRAIRRRREYAVRLALGARPAAILRESLCEGLVLSLTGGLLGLLLATFLIRTALHLLPESMPRIAAISVDGAVAAFALGISILSGTLCSLAPAFAAMHTNLIDGLKAGDRTSTGGSSHSLLRSGLVVAEIAVALVLLTTSAAFVRSLQKMRAVDPGFRPDHVLVAGYQLPVNQYSTKAAVERFNRELLDRLKAAPGVTSAGLANALPASGTLPLATYTIEGQDPATWKLQFSNFAIVEGDYFRAMGIRLLQGRVFTEDDRAGNPLVVVVNETMAKTSWPGQNPIGKRLHAGNPRKGHPWATVAGIVADTKAGARDEPSSAQWYMPMQQMDILFGATSGGNLTHPASGFLALRSQLPPERMIDSLRSAAAEVDPLLALQQVETMEDVISTTEAPRKFNTNLITAFAAAALLLAITGIYAVIAFTVSLRNRELAIRMALGAQRGNITRLVLSSGARLALTGCAIGLIGSIIASQLLKSFLFQVSAADPFIYLTGIGIMLAMALIAAFIPARRAASADPVDALRSA